MGITGLSSGTFPHFIAKWYWLVVTQGTVCSVIDVLNTASICFYLFRMRSSYFLQCVIVFITLDGTPETIRRRDDTGLGAGSV